jgi:hypothetical protein
MQNRYAIWNKQDPIITPTGKVFTADQWIEKYPVAALPNIVVVCSAGEINGGFFGTLGQLTQMYGREGCDFSECNSPEEQLAAIETFLQVRDAEAKAKAEEEAAAKAANEELNAASLASIAAQLEFQNMMSLDDVEVE